MDIVTCDRGVGRRTPFTGEFVATFLILYSLKAVCWAAFFVALSVISNWWEVFVFVVVVFLI
ncbi:hypothetical protein KYX80_07620 [Enterococcus lactis]|nr:hypothetical protein [Enterococcus lactis]